MARLFSRSIHSTHPWSCGINCPDRHDDGDDDDDPFHPHCPRIWLWCHAPLWWKWYLKQKKL